MTSKQFLAEAILRYRSSSEKYWSDTNIYSIRNSLKKNNQNAGLWFRTEGCSWAYIGSCMMCNYSFGPKTTSKQIVSYVKEGLTKLDDNLNHLLISPSGSMLDSIEVPDEARDEIFELLSLTHIKSFSFETRPETIKDSVIRKIQTILNGRLTKVLLGVETINQSYQKYCINKQIDLSTYVNAFNILKSNNVKPIANILLGLPFLTDLENIEAACQSITWSLENGASYCYLFPVHVKEGTALAPLYSKGQYRTISLWALIEVMANLKEMSSLNKIRPSWFTSLNAYNVIASPYTCDKCFDKVVSLLNHYDCWLDEKSLNKLFNFKCSCRTKWRAESKREEKNKQPLLNRIYQGYEIISDDTKISLGGEGSTIFNEVKTTLINNKSIKTVKI